jgi:Family of unknown function (DUF5941)
VTEPLVVYRDDGLAAGVPLRWPGRLALPAVVVGAVALLVALVLDGRNTGWLTFAGTAVFILAATGGRATMVDRRMGWLTIPLLRTAEYGLVTCLAWRAGGAAPAYAFVLLFALAFRHYDAVHRLHVQGAPPARWASASSLGWQLRMAVVVSAAAAGVFAPVALALAAAVGMSSLVDSVTSWRSTTHPADSALGVGRRDG